MYLMLSLFKCHIFAQYCIATHCQNTDGFEVWIFQNFNKNKVGIYLSQRQVHESQNTPQESIQHLNSTESAKVH